jgi:hypothetical protein
MSNESSRDIERMFQDDIRDKRKAGSGAFHRKGKGSSKARVSGGVIFAKTKFKRYEKNSKTHSVNVFNEVVSLEEFNKFDDDMKRRIILEWRRSKNYSNHYIMTGMGMHYKGYRNEMERLGILNEVNKDVQVEMKELTQEELIELENSDVLDKEEFTQIPDWQKYMLSIAYKRRGLTNKDVATKLGYEVSSYNTKKSNWKKAYEDYESNLNSKGEDSMPADFEYKDDLFLIGQQPKEEKDNKNEDNSEKEEPIITFEDKATGEQLIVEEVWSEESTGNDSAYNGDDPLINFRDSEDKQVKQQLSFANFFSEEEEYTGYEAANKLRALAQLVDGNDKFKVEIDIKKQKR